MAKYYVKSGQIRFIIDCTDHICAIIAALTHYKGKGIITGTYSRSLLATCRFSCPKE